MKKSTSYKSLTKALILHLRQRQTANPRFSLRNLAQKLDLDSSYLSKIMSGQRPMSDKAAKKVSHYLKIEPQPMSPENEIDPFAVFEFTLPPNFDSFGLSHDVLLTTLALPKVNGHLESARALLNWTHEKADSLIRDLESFGFVEKQRSRYKTFQNRRSIPSNPEGKRVTRRINQELAELSKERIPRNQPEDVFFNFTFTFTQKNRDEVVQILRQAFLKIGRLSDKTASEHDQVYNFLGSLMTTLNYPSK